jgi:hypothetical protein
MDTDFEQEQAEGSGGELNNKGTMEQSDERRRNHRGTRRLNFKSQQPSSREEPSFKHQGRTADEQQRDKGTKEGNRGIRILNRR